VDERIVDGTIKPYLNELFDVNLEKDPRKTEIKRKTENMWKEIFGELGLSTDDFSYEFKHKKIDNVLQYDDVSKLPLIQLILYYKKKKYSGGGKKTATGGGKKTATGGGNKPATGGGHETLKQKENIVNK
jgi:hypothetical protein